MSTREPDPSRRTMQDLARSAAIEIIPVRGVEEQLAAVPLDVPVTITCSPRFGLERTLRYTEIAVQAGFRVVPHLAARQVTGEAQLQDFVGRLGEWGVRDLFVIGGDVPEPAGRFTSAAELLDCLAGLDHTIASIGVACYPEGHPTIPDDELAEALQRKQVHAQYMVSQLCFDAAALVGWLRRMRALGVKLPLHIGLAAPLHARKLAELSLRIGVGPSLRYVTKQHGLLGRLLRGSAHRPERLLLDIGPDLDSAELAIEALHLFSFNQIDGTVAWQRAVTGPPR